MKSLFGASCNTNKLILVNQTETKMAFRLFLLFPVLLIF